MKNVHVDRLVETFGKMQGDLMNLGLLPLNPARLMIAKYVSFLENMDCIPFVENFIRMEKWILDSPDVPGETFRQFVKDCYQKNQSDCTWHAHCRLHINRHRKPTAGPRGRSI